ncbi:hypothetical protein D3C78_1911370 [compost metagenome]
MAGSSFNKTCQSLRSMMSADNALTGDRLNTDTPRARHCSDANRNDGSIRVANLRARRLDWGLPPSS